MLERLRELAEWGPSASRLAQLVLAAFLAFRGRVAARVAELVDRGLDDGRLLAEEGADIQSASLAVAGLIFADELEHAHMLIQAMRANAQARGSVAGFANFAANGGLIMLRCGELAEAEADTRAAYELALEHDLINASELRVTRLAAQPMSNQDIAQALFITAKTVSDHLSSVYRKLNISSRAELATALEDHAPPSVLSTRT